MIACGARNRFWKCLFLLFCFVSILLSFPLHSISSPHERIHDTSTRYSDPSLFTLGVQEGDWREYNVTTLYHNPIFYPDGPLAPVFENVGQKLLVEITNVTSLYYAYSITVFHLNGSVSNTVHHSVPRDEKPSFAHYVTTTNFAYLTEDFDGQRFIHKIRNKECIIQWVRNSTTYPDYFEENCSYIEEWRIDLSTGWRNSYSNILVNNRSLHRHIVVEVTRSGTKFTPPLSGLEIIPSLFFLGIVVLFIRRYQMK